MRTPFINEEQTSALRKFKYKYARARGVHKALAGRMRDWHLKGFIGQMSKQNHREFAVEHIDFYASLAEAHIQLWREKTNETEFELTPEEDHDYEVTDE